MSTLRTKRATLERIRNKNTFFLLAHSFFMYSEIYRAIKVFEKIFF